MPDLIGLWPDSTIDTSGAPKRLADGTTGYTMRSFDDCFPACVATVLGIPLRQLPQLGIDRRLRSGIDPQLVERDADKTMGHWRMVEHNPPPWDVDRWVGVCEHQDWRASHCLVMSRDEVLHDPAPVNITLLGVRLGLRVWAPDDIGYGITFDRTNKE
jgi:hypothetical protein